MVFITGTEVSWSLMPKYSISCHVEFYVEFVLRALRLRRSHRSSLPQGKSLYYCRYHATTDSPLSSTLSISLCLCADYSIVSWTGMEIAPRCVGGSFVGGSAWNVAVSSYIECNQEEKGGGTFVPWSIQEQDGMIYCHCQVCKERENECQDRTIRCSRHAFCFCWRWRRAVGCLLQSSFLGLWDWKTWVWSPWTASYAWLLSCRESLVGTSNASRFSFVLLATHTFSKLVYSSCYKGEWFIIMPREQMQTHFLFDTCWREWDESECRFIPKLRQWEPYHSEKRKRYQSRLRFSTLLLLLFQSKVSVTSKWKGYS